MVSRSRVGADSVTIGFPAVPGGPPDFLLGYKSLRIGGPPAGTAERPGVRTPPACPESGSWTNTLTFTYRDGVTQTQTATTPCRAGARAPVQHALPGRPVAGRAQPGRQDRACRLDTRQAAPAAGDAPRAAGHGR